MDYRSNCVKKFSKFSFKNLSHFLRKKLYALAWISLEIKKLQQN